MRFIYSDGGRSKYFKGRTGDCVVRAICNATGRDYKEVYDAINEMGKTERTSKRKRGKSNARTGVYKVTIHRFIEDKLGWEWHPTMQIGQGCKVHLDKDELPQGVIIVNVSSHLTCVKDGVIYDTYDCSREGGRCVYGYWTKKEEEVMKDKPKASDGVKEKIRKATNEYMDLIRDFVIKKKDESVSTARTKLVQELIKEDYAEDWMGILNEMSKLEGMILRLLD